MNSRLSSRSSKTIIFFIAVIVFVAVQYIFSARYKINDSNMYLYSNNYFEGFCSAGLIGTLIRIVGTVFNVDLLNYEGIYAFGKVSLVIYFIAMFVFLIALYVKTSTENKNKTELMIIIMLSLTGSMFCTTSTLGSADMYMAIILFIMLSVIVIHDLPILTIILSIVGTLIHPNFIIICAPIISVYYYYKWKIKAKPKYKYYLFAMLIIDAIVFIVSEATSFGDEYSTLLTPEWSHIDSNYINLIIYIVLMMPWFWIGYKCIRGMIAGASNRRTYQVIAFGIAPILLGFIFTSTYGYMVYFICLYYLITFMLMIYENDKLCIGAVDNTVKAVKSKLPMAELTVVYPVLLYPLTSKAISPLIDNIVDLFV